VHSVDLGEFESSVMILVSMKTSRAASTGTRNRGMMIAAWATPLMLGPWLSIAGVVAAYAFLGPEVPYVPRAVVLGVGLALGAVVGALYVAVSAAVDVGLLAIKLRALPTGSSAVLAAMVPPIVFTASYALIQPWRYWRGGPWLVVLLFALPPIVAAIAGRAVFSRRVP
jgi:hypothetical protein